MELTRQQKAGITKRNTLTRKELGFVRDVIKTKNPAEAARRNYNINGQGGTTGSSAYAIAFDNLRKPKIARLLQDSGLTADYLVRTLKDTIDSSENDNARLKGIEIGFKLHGELGDKGNPGANINIYQQYNSLNDNELNNKIEEIQNNIKKLQAISV